MKKYLSVFIVMAMLISCIVPVRAETDPERNSYEEEYNVAYYQGGIDNEELIDPETFPYINKITSVDELSLLSLSNTADVEEVSAKYDEAFFAKKFLAVISWVEAQGARTRYLYDVDAYEVGSDDDFFSPTMGEKELDSDYDYTAAITPYCAVLEVPLLCIDNSLSVKCIEFDVEPTPAPIYHWDGGVEIIPPIKTVYIEGEYLDLTGMEAYGTSGIRYSDGTNEITVRDALSIISIEPSDRPLTVEDTTVTVKGTYWIMGSFPLEGTFEITVLPASEATPTPEPPCYEVVSVPAPTVSVASGKVPYGQLVTIENNSGIGTLMYSFYGNSWIEADSPLKLIIGDETTVSVKVSVPYPEPNKEYICEEATYTYTIDDSLESPRNEYEERYNVSYYNGGIGNEYADDVVEPYGNRISSVWGLSSLWIRRPEYFAAVKEKYDEEFFKENFLVVVSWEQSHGARDRYLEKVEIEENDVNIVMGEAFYCGSSTTAFDSFCAIVEIPKSEKDKALELNGKYFYVPPLCVEPIYVPAPDVDAESGMVAFGTEITISPVYNNSVEYSVEYSINGSEFAYAEGTVKLSITEDTELVVRSRVNNPDPDAVYMIDKSVYTYTIDPETIPLDKITVDGDGSEENPFVINTARELMAMPYFSSDTPQYINHYILGSDIDLSEYGKDYNDGKGWTPLAKFYGVLDGNNKTITGLYINNPELESSGLFSSLAGGEIKNLRLENVYINGGDNTGAIAGIGDSRIPGNGEIGNSFTIHDCYVSGTVIGGDNTGGIVGATNFGGVSRCCVDASVSGNNNVGGIAGDIGTHSGASHNMSRGNVTGAEKVGGIVGIFAGENGTFACNYSTGKISGTELVGGIVGLAGGSMSWSTITGNVSIAKSVEGTSQVGRVSGYNGTNLFENYAFSDVKVIVDGEEKEITGGIATMEGESVAADELYSAAFWESINYISEIWKIEDGKLPVLLGMEDTEEPNGEYIVTFDDNCLVQVYTDENQTERLEAPYKTTDGKIFFRIVGVPGGGNIVNVNASNGTLVNTGDGYLLTNITEDVLITHDHYTGPILDLEVEKNEDGSIVANVTAGYASAIAPDGTVILAAYTAEGALYSVQTADNKDWNTFTFEAVPDNVTTFKAMWWESMADMKPIATAQECILE